MTIAEIERRVRAITAKQRANEVAFIAQGVLDPPDWVPPLGSFAEDNPKAHKLFETPRRI